MTKKTILEIENEERDSIRTYKIFLLAIFAVIMIAVLIWSVQTFSFSGTVTFNQMNFTGNFSMPWMLVALG